MREGWEGRGKENEVSRDFRTTVGDSNYPRNPSSTDGGSIVGSFSGPLPPSESSLGVGSRSSTSRTPISPE